MSATQISFWNECQRKWAFRYLEKIYPAPKPGAKLGDDTHQKLKTYFSTNTLPIAPDLVTDLALAAIEELPAPNRALSVEEKFYFLSPTRAFVWVGLADLIDPRGSVPRVHDHKTTKDFKWAKTKEELVTDPQATLYAVYAMSRFRAEQVDLSWLYIRTVPTKKGVIKTRKVEARVSKDDVCEKFAEIDDLGAELVKLHRAKPATLTLKANRAACGSYGGCPYLSKCPVTEDETSDLGDFL